MHPQLDATATGAGQVGEILDQALRLPHLSLDHCRDGLELYIAASVAPQDTRAVRQHGLGIAQLVRKGREEAVLQQVGARERFVASLQRVLQLFQIGAIGDDLAEAAQLAVRRANRSDSAKTPEPRAVLAYVPALVRGASHARCGLQLQSRDSGIAVFLREDVVQLAADDVAGIETHDLRRTRVPVQDATLRIHRENCVVLHGLHELVEQLAVGRRRLTGIGHFAARPPAANPWIRV